MKTNSVLVQQALKRAEVFQQLVDVPNELLELLPAFIAAMERIGFDPAAVIQKSIEKAKRFETQPRAGKVNHDQQPTE